MRTKTFVRLSVGVLLACLSLLQVKHVLATEALYFEPPTMPRVSQAEWTRFAVRKVLHAFAYGGQATDAQIRLWSSMPPELAIVEMLTFDEHNLKLSPPAPTDLDDMHLRSGTMVDLQEFWSTNASGNRTPGREQGKYAQIAGAWTRAATSRGLNPFRHKIGLWETNYHMANNLARGITGMSMTRYYDDIMNNLALDLPYQDVMAGAATSAATAIQYGHHGNRFIDGNCRCNEDFAREYHQLYFGILGDTDPDTHENVTIKNTAIALTGMVVEKNEVGEQTGGITYPPEEHYPYPLDILNVSVAGNNANNRISELSQYAIDHPESLENLPVIIIAGLADDNLDDSGKMAIRDAWAALQPKNLLTFIRAYAISTLFHNINRVKYASSIDRHLFATNVVQLSNEEGYLELYRPDYFRREDVWNFQPTHNVFGGQTGREAAKSVKIFRLNYKLATDSEWRYRVSEGRRYYRNWKKDWGSVVPSVQNKVPVYVAAWWLWERFTTSRSKIRILEAAHLWAILATGNDLGYAIDPENPDQVYTTRDFFTNFPLFIQVVTYAFMDIPINSSDPEIRALANERMGSAANFISATPFVFAQQGK